MEGSSRTPEGKLWKQMRDEGSSPRGEELLLKIKDYMRLSPTKVWLCLGEGRIFIVKDTIKGFHLRCSYRGRVFVFRNQFGEEEEVQEDTIQDVAGF